MRLVDRLLLIFLRQDLVQYGIDVSLRHRGKIFRERLHLVFKAAIILTEFEMVHIFIEKHVVPLASLKEHHVWL